MSQYFKTALALTALLFSQSGSVFKEQAYAESGATAAASSAPAGSVITSSSFPSQEEIAKQLESSNILDNHATFSAKFNKEMNSLLIRTALISGSTPKDYKISALLVARAAMKMCGNKLPRVTVVFRSSDPENPSRRSVVIRAGDVVAFASKLESPDVLLDSIDISVIDPKAKLPLQIHPSKPTIDEALKQSRTKINDLKNRRVGVQEFQKLCNEVVVLEKARDYKGAAQQLESLNQHLNEQESIIESLHKRR